MKYRFELFVSLALAVMLVFSACGGGAATEAPYFIDEAVAPAEPAAMPELEKSGNEAGAPVVADAFAMPTMAPAFEIANPEGENVVVQSTNRKIIKNADVRLLVKDTDVAIDRTTQIIGDLGGYIISSRVWYQDYYGNNLKYATMTLGIPVDQFERALTRLRELSIRVLDENASGEDVTDQYVDLQSQLQNLEATRARMDGLPPATIASMQKDIMAGKPSELDQQTGAVVRMGKASNIPTPTHEKILAALLPLEQKARTK